MPDTPELQNVKLAYETWISQLETEIENLQDELTKKLGKHEAYGECLNRVIQEINN